MMGTLGTRISTARTTCFLSSLLLAGATFTQPQLPVLRSSVARITIVDGDERRVAYWSLDPSARPDVYTADRTRRTKEVRFVTNLDSLSFILRPGDQYDFLILLNGADSCYTRLRSAVTPAMLAYVPPQEVAPPDTIPFHLSPTNNVLLQAVLNGMDTLTLMFHTGMRGVAITEQARMRLRAFHAEGSAPVHTWGGGAEGAFSQHNDLHIGGRHVQDLTIHVDEQSGAGTDGKVGYDFFADQVLELDHDKGLLIVHDRPPADLHGQDALPLEFVRGSMYIRCSVRTENGLEEHPFMVHTGYSGALIFGARAAMVVRDTLGMEMLRDSYNNELRNVRTTIPELVVGAHHFTDVPASVMDPRAAIEANVIGADLLKRFNWVLDLRNDVLHLAPNRSMGMAHWTPDSSRHPAR